MKQDLETGWLGGGTRPELFWHWLPAPDARRCAVFVHGYGEHSGRYVETFRALAAHGIACFGFDLRGHGRSRNHSGYIRAFDEFRDDVDAAFEQARTLRRTLEGTARDWPFALVAHSFGGLVATDWLLASGGAEDLVDRFALSSPAFRFRVPVPAWKKALAHAASAVWPRLTLPSGVDSSMLSHDPDVAEQVRADPLMKAGSAYARWYTESLAAQDRVAARAHELRLPVLALVSGDDALVDEHATRTVFDAFSSSDKTWCHFPDHYHELFHEADRATVWHTLAAWLEPGG